MTNTSFSDADRRFMMAAIALARRGQGDTAENPPVGALVVKDGRVVGRGWTARGGRPHAETQALRQAGALARGATVYVTLEPCSHTGRTPPCTNALIDAGVARVVVASGDPDPRVNGGGVARLTAAGITVESGVCADAASEGVAGFLSRVTRGRPLVSVKLATSIDGRIATASGDSQWITGPRARQHGHWLRATHDAILVGSGTALADSPSLTCRIPGLEGRDPVRVFLDRRGRLDIGAVSQWASSPALIYGQQENSNRDGVEQLAWSGDIPGLLADLADRGINRLLVEGGGTVVASFLSQDCVDALYHYTGDCVIGGDGISAVDAFQLSGLSTAPRFKLVSERRWATDRLAYYRRGE